MAAISSLVVVLPLEPVTAHDAGPRSRRRWARASAPSARACPSTSSSGDARPERRPAARATTAPAAPAFAAAARKSWPSKRSPVQRDEERARRRWRGCRWQTPATAPAGAGRSQAAAGGRAARSSGEGRAHAGSAGSAARERLARGLLAVVEVALLGADDLVVLVALAGDEHHVARPGQRRGERDGRAPVGSTR